METMYVPPPEISLPPPPPIQLSTEERRKQRLIKIIHTTGSALRRILAGLVRVIEDVAESIMRR